MRSYCIDVNWKAEATKPVFNRLLLFSFFDFLLSDIPWHLLDCIVGFIHLIRQIFRKATYPLILRSKCVSGDKKFWCSWKFCVRANLMTPHAALKITEFIKWKENADRKRVKGTLPTFFLKKGLVLRNVESLRNWRCYP